MYDKKNISWEEYTRLIVPNRNNHMATQIRRPNRFNNRNSVNFPEINIVDVNKLEEGNRSCMICLDEFHTGEKVTALPCIHFFHEMCIKNWFNIKQFCPICKLAINNNNNLNNY